MLEYDLEKKSGQEPMFQPGRFSVLKRIIVFIACLIIIVVLLSHAGSFLVSNGPERADVILILAGGGDDSRYRHAIELRKQGYADMILLDASVSQTIFGKSEADLATEFLSRTSSGLVELCSTYRIRFSVRPPVSNAAWRG